MDLVVDAMAKLFSVITGKTPRFKVSSVAGFLCNSCKSCLGPAVQLPDEEGFSGRLLESIALVHMDRLNSGETLQHSTRPFVGIPPTGHGDTRSGNTGSNTAGNTGFLWKDAVVPHAGVDTLQTPLVEALIP